MFQRTKEYKNTTQLWPQWTPTEEPRWKFWPTGITNKRARYCTAFICEDKSIIRGDVDFQWFSPITGEGYYFEGYASFKNFYARATLCKVIGNKLLLNFSNGLYTLEKPTAAQSFKSTKFADSSAFT
ncbi:MAG: hypothetical protein ACYCQI_11720, partial [Gammaproteobacteria bacterium]